MAIVRPANLSTLEPYRGPSHVKTRYVSNESKHYDPNFEVLWNGADDAGNPLNWSPTQSWTVIIVCSLLVLNVAIASSAPEMTTPQYVTFFGISQEIANLNLALFIAGYCAGPLAWGPLSETYGRRVVYLISCGGYVMGCVGSASSHNIATLLAFRFVSGTFGAAALSIAGAVIGDVLPTEKRGCGICIFSLTQIFGATLGSVIGGYIQSYHHNWRSIFWICTIAGTLCWILLLIFLAESYAPLLLKRKAALIRLETGDRRYWAQLETEDRNFRSQVMKSLVRPFKMLLGEPLLLVITLYTSFLYGILYMMFGILPVVANVVHHLGPLESGATFMAMAAGGSTFAVVYMLYYAPRYKRLCQEYAPSPFPPEHRLGPAKVGAVLFPASILILGWTNYESVNLAFPMLATGLLGISIMSAFVSLYDYLIETYLECSATALSVNMTLRSVSGSVLPMTSSILIHRLGFNWAATLIGGIALIGLPMPFLLAKYAPRLHKMRKAEPCPHSSEKDWG